MSSASRTYASELSDNVLIRVVVQEVYSVLVVLTRTLGYFVSSLELAALNAFDLLCVYADYNVIIIEIAGVSLRINIAEVDAVSVEAGDSNCISNGLYRLDVNQIAILSVLNEEALVAQRTANSQQIVVVLGGQGYGLLAGPSLELILGAVVVDLSNLGSCEAYRESEEPGISLTPRLIAPTLA